MIRKCIPQEGLKLIACLSMLIDHTGVIFGLGMKWRVIGRLAFPIYCFLLAEGVHHTKNLKKYMMRLAGCAVISEFAFDYALYGRCVWQSQNVMLTLLLGVLALAAMKDCPNLPLKLLAAIPFAAVAELCRTDYGWHGVMLVALFGIARELPFRWPVLTLGMAGLFLLKSRVNVTFLGISMPLSLFGLASLFPMALYSGEKLTRSKVVQWEFYLFYPVHLVLLRLIWIGLHMH